MGQTLKDFEFISSQEARDFDRLKLDRNLCAHPAFSSQDLLFQPSPEAARTHIVHAVMHLLQHPPVQGKSALDRLKQDLLQPSFPQDQEAVSAFLENKYLDHCKPSLRANLVTVFLKVLLLQIDHDLIGKEREIEMSLAAVRRKFPDDYEQAMTEHLAHLLEGADDHRLIAGIRILRMDNRAWTWLPEHLRIRYEGIARAAALDPSDDAMMAAWYVPQLKGGIIARFEALDDEQKEAIILKHPIPEFIDTAIKIYSGVKSWRHAERVLEKLIVPLAEIMSPAQVAAVCDIVEDNYDANTAHGTPALMRTFFKKTERIIQRTTDAWTKLLASLLDSNAQYDALYNVMRRYYTFGVMIQESKERSAKVLGLKRAQVEENDLETE